MSIEYHDDLAVFTEVASVSDADLLLEWAQGRTPLQVDLAACTHLHAANLQVLMAAQPEIVAWPLDQGLADWLQHALPSRP